MVDHVFDDHLFHVYIEAQKTDKGKLVKEFLILRICVFEDFPGAFEAAHERSEEHTSELQSQR